MKKLYSLFLFCCLGFAAFGQTTVTLYSTGATGTLITGSATSTVTTDGNIVTTSTTTRGYAVFDLSSIPASATITSCVIGFNVSASAGGPASGWNTYGYAGDLSTVITPGVLFADMVAGTSLSTASYGTTPGNKTLISTAAATTFIQAHAGTKVSICFTGGGPHFYTITGETGTATTGGTHAPYLQITYTCAGISGVSASATPNPLCVGAVLSLSGSSTGGVRYSWVGPGSFTSTMQSPTDTTNAASGGVYTLTAYNAGGCGVKAITANVVLSATPVASVSASPSLTFCAGGNVVMTATAGAYTYQWEEGGVILPGATDQTYTAMSDGLFQVVITNIATGCPATSPNAIVTVIPSVVTLTPAGSANVCTGNQATLAVVLPGTSSGIGYQWVTGGAAISGATDSSYTTGVAGTYSAVLSAPLAGCTDTSIGTVVNVLALPVPVVTYVAPTLSTGIPYTTYQWYLNLVQIPGATSRHYTPTDIGSYRVSVTDGFGCANYSAPYPVNYLGVGLVNTTEVSIYPNPAGNTLHITAAVPLRAVIMSMEGKTMMETADVGEIDISRLRSGL